MKIPEKRTKKKSYIITGGILSIGILLVIITFAYGFYNKQKKEQGTAVVYNDAKGTEKKSGSIVYQGKEYTYNEHLSNFLFLGIDKQEKAETKTGKADAGQADSIFLISWDRVQGNVTWITIPRDTMAEIQIFDQEGNHAGTSVSHLNLAYAFGDGERESCQLMEDAVSNLFYGLPIQGSCAINLDGIPVLAEAAEGITVTIPDENICKVNPEWVKGATVTLNKDNTENFVRYRDKSKNHSALERMERQKVFLVALGEKMQQMYKKNPGIISDLYMAMDDYLVTDIGNDMVLKLMEDLGKHGVAKEWTLPGKATEGTDFDEYHPEEDELYEKILDTFYLEEEPK